MSLVDVWVPRDSTRTDLEPGSGIVGRNQAGGKVLIYYEGNLYGAENMRRYVERVMHAWDRMETRYPTIAREVVSREDLVWVGKYATTVGKVVIEPENRPVLAKWLGVTSIPERELNL